MHDQEKSDSAAVAAKSPNKAGSPAAEAVEPRAGTKGNVDQQSTHRTQTRERVTQALNRVRQVARQRKKERFTALRPPCDRRLDVAQQHIAIAGRLYGKRLTPGSRR